MVTAVSTESVSRVESDPVVDLQQLLHRCMGSLELADRCLMRFQQKLEADVEHLQQLVSAGNVGEVTRVAHQIRGSAATIAASPLAKTAAALERAARQGRDDELIAAVETFVVEVDRFMNAIPCFSQIG